MPNNHGRGDGDQNITRNITVGRGVGVDVRNKWALVVLGTTTDSAFVPTQVRVCKDGMKRIRLLLSHGADINGDVTYRKGILLLVAPFDRVVRGMVKRLPRQEF